MNAFALAAARSMRHTIESTSRARGGLVILLTLSFLVTSFFVFWRVVAYLHASPMIGGVLVVRLLSMAFLTFLLVLAFSAVVVSLATLYASDELPMLLASPASPRRVFAAKAIEACVQASWMVLLACVPILGAYAFEFQAPWTFLPVAAAAVVLFVVPPCALGILITLAIVRAFSAQTSRDAVLAGGALSAAAVLGYFKLLQPAEWVKPGEGGEALKFLAEIAAPMHPALPSHWVTVAVMAGLSGQWNEIWRPAALLVTAAGVSIAVLAIASRAYLPAWRRAQESVTRGGLSSGRSERRTRRLLPLPGALGAILRKDVTVFRRQWSQWSQLALLLTLVYVYVMNLRELPLEEYKNVIPGMDLVSVFYFLNIAFAGGIITAVATRFTYPAVSWEGRAVWLVRTAPIPDGAVLRSKLLLSAVPLLLLAVGILYVATQTMQVEPFLRRLAYATMGSFAIGLSSLGVAVGAAFPRMHARNASEAASSPGGLAFMVLGYFFILATVVLEAGIVRLAERIETVHFDWAGRTLGLQIATLVILHAVYWLVPYGVGIRAFRKLED